MKLSDKEMKFISYLGGTKNDLTNNNFEKLFSQKIQNNNYESCYYKIILDTGEIKEIEANSVEEAVSQLQLKQAKKIYYICK